MKKTMRKGIILGAAITIAIGISLVTGATTRDKGMWGFLNGVSVCDKGMWG